jgi:hypothetical protein
VGTLGEQLCRRGRIERGAHRAAWVGGGRRFELAHRNRTTVLTCTDAWAWDARITSAIYIIALIVLCAFTPDSGIIAGSAFVVLVSCAAAIRSEPARARRSHELFEYVAELVGDEVWGRGLPARPALAAGDQRAR